MRWALLAIWLAWLYWQALTGQWSDIAWCLVSLSMIWVIGMVARTLTDRKAPK